MAPDGQAEFRSCQLRYEPTSILGSPRRSLQRSKPVRATGACHGITAAPMSPGRPTSPAASPIAASTRSEEHTSELQSLIRSSYAVFCLKKKKPNHEQSQT